MTTETNASLPQEKTMTHYLRKWYYGVLYWMYVYIWCRYCYRHIMKLMHKFNLHYTRVVMPFEKEEVVTENILGNIRIKKQHLHCSWCGLRGEVLKYEHKD